MEVNKVKEQLNSLIKVFENAFNVKKNPLSEYSIPILKDALSLIEEQRKKIHNQKQALAGNTKCIQGQQLEMKSLKKLANEELQAAKKDFERELDELKFKYFSETVELKGKLEDYERERAALIRDARLTKPRRKHPIRIWIKNKND